MYSIIFEAGVVNVPFVTCGGLWWFELPIARMALILTFPLHKGQWRRGWLIFRCLLIGFLILLFGWETLLQCCLPVAGALWLRRLCGGFLFWGSQAAVEGRLANEAREEEFLRLRTKPQPHWEEIVQQNSTNSREALPWLTTKPSVLTHFSL